MTNQAKIDHPVASPRFPQEPLPPYSYHEEEVEFQSVEAGVTLSGTLTVPGGEGPFPCALLIAGYGPQDRDAMLLGHKTFLVLADYLTRVGIAVLRADKRGVGKSTGDFAKATSRDFADDVRASIEYIKTRKEIAEGTIGLIGFNDGSIVVTMVAAECSDVAFVICLGGIFQNDPSSLLSQASMQMRADGASELLLSKDRRVRELIYSIVQNESDEEKAYEYLQRLIMAYCSQLSEELKKETVHIPFAVNEQKSDLLIKIFNSAWFRHFLQYQPVEDLKKITIPFLAVTGDLDWVSSPQQNFPLITKALEEAGNKDYSLRLLSKVNHRFQTSQTGSMLEYGTLQETMSEVAMRIVAEWILRKTIKKVRRSRL